MKDMIVKYVDITPTVEIDQREDIKAKVKRVVDEHIEEFRKNSSDGKVRLTPLFQIGLQNKIRDVLEGEMIELGMDISVLPDPIDPQVLNFKAEFKS